MKGKMGMGKGNKGVHNARFPLPIPLSPLSIRSFPADAFHHLPFTIYPFAYLSLVAAL